MIVITDTEQYINEANCYLTYRNSYNVLPEVFTLQHNTIVDEPIEQFKNERSINQKIIEGLKLVNQKTPKVYVF